MKTMVRLVTVGLFVVLSLNAWGGRAENNALVSAIYRNDVDAVKRAVEQGADVNARMMGGKTPLAIAEKEGYTEIAEVLKQHGAGGGDTVSKSRSIPEESEQPARRFGRRSDTPRDPAPEPVPAVAKVPAEPEPEAASQPEVPVASVVTEETPVVEEMAVEEVVEVPVEAAVEEEVSEPAEEPSSVEAEDKDAVTALREAGITPAPGDAVAKAREIVASQALSKEYNPVVVDFLVEEGTVKLPEDVRKAALDQLVVALKQRTTVTKDEQLYTALGALAGIGMGAAGDDVISDAGGDVESSYAGEYASWVDAAFKLIHAGYPEDAAAFFEYGLTYLPYPSLQARCVKGLALARPDQAYDFLMDQVENAPDDDRRNAALRMLGYLAADPNIAQDKKEAILDVLVDYTQGMLHANCYGAAVYALDVCGDPRGKEALERFKSGMTHDKQVQRAALRSLLLTYEDPDIAPILRKQINRGMLSMSDWTDELYAGRLLTQIQDPEAFKWADKKLSKTRKGFFDSDSEPDLKPDIVTIMVNYGGDKGCEVLAGVVDKYRDKDWLKTWIATGMLELGDPSEIDLVKKSIQNPNWDFTAIRITEALAKHGDYSGLAALQQLIEKRPPKKSSGMKLLGALAGKQDDTKAKARRLARLRIQIADALARMNQPACVPLLVKLLSDEDMYVRSSAAMALTRMTIPDALDGLDVAVAADYGTIDGLSRNPVIQARVARAAALRFPDDPRTADILAKARASNNDALAFLGLVAQ